MAKNLSIVGLAFFRADPSFFRRADLHASDLGRLAALRNTLRGQALASPLFDAPRFARHLEATLWGMWERRQGR